jgi:hypothetical protein
VLGVAAFASAAGLEVLPSPNREHAPYVDAPEISRWLSR